MYVFIIVYVCIYVSMNALYRYACMQICDYVMYVFIYVCVFIYLYKYFLCMYTCGNTLRKAPLE